MLTHETTVATTVGPLEQARSVAQKVVIVNGSAGVLELVETVLDAGHYDVVFVESSEHAYSQIKRVLPNLVILCVRVDDHEALQVLSMLKLDGETRAIPVLTYTTDLEGPSTEEEITDTSATEMFTAKPAVWMN
jgi:PleD family two-component response regulator